MLWKHSQWGLPIGAVCLLWTISASAWSQRTPQNDPAIPKTKIAIFENPNLVSKFQVDESKYADAFERMLCTYTGKNSVADAWKTLVSSDDTVGIHLTCPGDYHLAPPKALVLRIVQGLKQAGVKPQKIIVWDKFAQDMIPSGYVPQESATDYSIRAVLPNGGFDPNVFYFNEVVGSLIWGDQEFVGKVALTFSELEAITTKDKDKDKDKNKKKDAAPNSDSPQPPPDQLSNRSHFAKIVTQQCTKIINVALMSDDQNVGLYGACASLALSSVDNMRRFTSEGIQGDPAIGEIITHAALKNKVVLHVMTGHIIQYAGGPQFTPHYTESAGLLMIGYDPVAIDTLALERIEKLRSENSVIPVIGNARHLKSAAQLGAGVNDLKQIQKMIVK